LRYRLSESRLEIRNFEGFPSYRVSGYRIVFSTGEVRSLPDLEEGEGVEIPLPENAEWCRVEKPGGFILAHLELEKKTRR
jgi:hypothetical protein